MRRLAPSLILVLAAASAPLLTTSAHAAVGDAGAVAGAVATGQAAHRFLDPAKLRRAGVPAPALAYLAGLKLTPGRGKGAAVNLVLPKADIPNLSLIGHGPQGYSLIDTTTVDGKQRYYNAPLTGKVPGKPHGFWKQDTPIGLDLYLSQDGSRILQENDGHLSGQEYTVFTTTGHKVPGFTQFIAKGNGTGILDFTGSRAILGTKGGIMDWKEGSNPATFVSGADSLGADIVHNLLFRNPSGDVVGPVALSNPTGAVKWRATGFDPLSVSPKGTLVLGFASNDDSSAIIVRNRSDGAVRSTVKLNRPGKSVAWEDNGHYLAVATGPSGTAVVRCNALTGGCVRTTAIFKTRVTLAAGYVFGSTTRR